MSLFVTATDTGVGKTLVTGGLVHALRARGLDVGCWKPIQSGELLPDPAGDVQRLKQLAGLADPEDVIGHLAYAEPLAPRLAMERAGEAVPLAALLRRHDEVRQQHQHLLTEGAGGLAVPLTVDATVAELAVALQHPLLIIARATLGTVNHTVLTVRYAQSLGLAVAGVILSGAGRYGDDVGEAHNPAYIEEYTGVPVLGAVPWLGLTPSVHEIRAAVAAHVQLDALIHHLTYR